MKTGLALPLVAALWIYKGYSQGWLVFALLSHLRAAALLSRSLSSQVGLSCGRSVRALEFAAAPWSRLVLPEYSKNLNARR